MKLAILGPPGSGKSTQAEIISARCGLVHIYAGEILRREAESGSPFAPRIRSYLAAGLLVPSDIVLLLIERELARAPGGYVLDGFPRTMEQTMELELLLRERDETLDAVVCLILSEEELLRRLLSRGRPDDTPEIITSRIRIYHSATDPVLQFYKGKDILVAVSGEGDTSQVADDILKAVHAKIALTGRAPTQSP